MRKPVNPRRGISAACSGLLAALAAVAGVSAASFHVGFESAADLRRAGGQIVGTLPFVGGSRGRAADFTSGGLVVFPVGDWFDPRAGTIRFRVRPSWAGSVVKRGILSHPPRSPVPGAYTYGRWRVELPAPPVRSRLLFFTGIAARRFPRMDGVTFQILVSAGDHRRTETVFEVHQRSLSWKRHEVDLSRYAGRSVDIEFRTTPGPPGSTTIADWGAWGEPRLIAERNGVREVTWDFVRRIDAAETGAVVPEYRFRYDDAAIRRYGLALIKGRVVTAPYFALLLQSRLRKKELKMEMQGRGGITPDGAAGLQATGDERGASVLAWTFDPGWDGERTFDLTFQGFRPGVPLNITRWLIDSTHSNPYYDYLIAKKSDNDGRYNLENGRPDIVESRTVRSDERGRYRCRFSLEPFAVTLIEIDGPPGGSGPAETHP